MHKLTTNLLAALMTVGSTGIFANESPKYAADAPEFIIKQEYSMIIIKYLFAIIIVTMLIGCGDNSSTENKASKGVIPKHQLKALEDAKNVEKIMLEAQEKMKKGMNDSGI